MKNHIKLIEHLSSSSQEFLKRGLKLIGPTSGAFLGTLSNEPGNVMMAATIGSVISQNINDFSERFLSEKEKDNISITEAFSIAKILENEEKEYKINEKLFNQGISGNAYELYHGVLNTAKNNYEDKKLEFLGRFYGNILFLEDLEPYFFHILLSMLKNLNYKQLCILSILGQHEEYVKDLKSVHQFKNGEKWYETYLIQNELSNMIAIGLLIPLNGPLLIPVDRRHLDNCRLGTLGELLFNLSELYVIEKEDLDDVIDKFK